MKKHMQGCPWCGQPATFEPFENCPGWGRMTLRHKDCFSKKETEEFPLPEEVAERWNRRAPDARDARIAELEAKLDAALAPKPAAYPELAPFTVAPWYPDDSGEWVEVPEDLMEMPAELQRFETIQTLRRAERVRQAHDAVEESAGGAGWAIPPEHIWRIVAYKVVKP